MKLLNVLLALVLPVSSGRVNWNIEILAKKATTISRNGGQSIIILNYNEFRTFDEISVKGEPVRGDGGGLRVKTRNFILKRPESPLSDESIILEVETLAEDPAAQFTFTIDESTLKSDEESGLSTFFAKRIDCPDEVFIRVKPKHSSGEAFSIKEVQELQGPSRAEVTKFTNL